MAARKVARWPRRCRSWPQRRFWPAEDEGEGLLALPPLHRQSVYGLWRVAPVRFGFSRRRGDVIRTFFENEGGRRPFGAGLAAVLKPRRRVFPLAGSHP